jgi:hypothetical protein
MLDTLSRVVFLMGGVTVSIVFILFGLFFLGWVFSRRGNGW